MFFLVCLPGCGANSGFRHARLTASAKASGMGIMGDMGVVIFWKKYDTSCKTWSLLNIRQRQKDIISQTLFFLLKFLPLWQALWISSHLIWKSPHFMCRGKRVTLRCQERQEAQDAERQKLSEKIRALERGETVPSSRFGYTTESTGTTSSGAGAALKTATSALKGGIGRLRDGLKIWPEDHGVFFWSGKVLVFGGHEL